MRPKIKVTINVRTILASAVAYLFFGGVPSAWALGSFSIQINAGPGLSDNPDALAAFERAAQEWESRIFSPITIYIDADLGSTDQSGATFPTNVIGETSFDFYTNDLSDINLPYRTVRNALVAHSSQPNDAILASLPTSAQVTAEVPTGDVFLKNTIGVLRANQRALGLLAASDTRADGSILFNSAFTFDYNRFDANGVAPGTIDFQTAATHEIGHVLGFESDVDDFDNGATSDNLTTLDLFRFPTSHAPTTPSEFQTFARELTPGTPSVLTDTSAQYPMSTGVNQGDGQQASHWQDDFRQDSNGNIEIGPLIGIMDPTLSSGTFETVSDADFRAMDLIGYDVQSVPEPSTSAFAFVSGAILLIAVRRQRSKTP